MKTFEQKKDNLGGALSLWAIHPDCSPFIFTDYSSGKKYLEFTDLPDKLIRFPYNEEKYTLSEQQKHFEFGLGCAISVQGTIPSNTDKNRELIDFLFQSGWFLLVLTINGTYHFCGTEYQLMMFECSPDLGENEKDLSAIPFKFQCVQNYPSLIVSVAEPVLFILNG